MTYFFILFYFFIFLSYLILFCIVAKVSQAKPQLQLSWLTLASLNFT